MRSSDYERELVGLLRGAGLNAMRAPASLGLDVYYHHPETGIGGFIEVKATRAKMFYPSRCKDQFNMLVEQGGSFIRNWLGVRFVPGGWVFAPAKYPRPVKIIPGGDGVDRVVDDAARIF